MIQYIIAYIKDIAIFLVFMTFIEIILPDSKYKSYINLVLGLLLIFVMLQPINLILNKFDKSIDRQVMGIDVELNKNIIDNEKQFYEDKQKEIVLKNFNNEMKKQINTLLDGLVIVLDCNVNLYNDENQFANIESISLTIEKLEEKEEKKRFIRIEPVTIDNSKQEETEIEEDYTIKNVKNIISNFYNLSVDNIYITVQKN